MTAEGNPPASLATVADWMFVADDSIRSRRVGSPIPPSRGCSPGGDIRKPQFFRAPKLTPVKDLQRYEGALFHGVC